MAKFIKELGTGGILSVSLIVIALVIVCVVAIKSCSYTSTPIKYTVYTEDTTLVYDHVAVGEPRVEFKDSVYLLTDAGDNQIYSGKDSVSFEKVNKD